MVQGMEGDMKEGGKRARGRGAEKLTRTVEMSDPGYLERGQNGMS